LACRYAGDFSCCNDVSRATIVVDTLDDLVIVVEAIWNSDRFRVVRVKNRCVPCGSVLARAPP